MDFFIVMKAKPNSLSHTTNQKKKSLKFNFQISYQYFIKKNEIFSLKMNEYQPLITNPV